MGLSLWANQSCSSLPEMPSLAPSWPPLPPHAWTHNSLPTGLQNIFPLPQTSDSMVFSKSLRWNLHSVKCTQLKCMSSGQLSTCVTIAPIMITECSHPPESAPFSESPPPQGTALFITISSFAYSWTYINGIVQEVFFSVCLLSCK